MRKLLIITCLFFINVTNAQTEVNIDEVIAPYLEEMTHKYERIAYVNKEILKLEGKQNDHEAIEHWKKLTCQRREAIRSYIQILNKISNSPEVNTSEASSAIKNMFQMTKNRYLIEIAQEDEMFQQSMVGEGNNTEGFEVMTIDFICQ